jgi:DNA-binding NtrC family response regulator
LNQSAVQGQANVDIRVIAATNRDLSQYVKDGNFREDLFYRLNVLAIHIPPLRSRPEDIVLLAEYFRKKYCNLIGKAEMPFSGAALEILRSHAWPGNVRELENTIAKAVHLCADIIHAEHVSELGRLHLEAPARFSPPLSPMLTRMKDLEETAIRQAIAACSGNISLAARGWEWPAAPFTKKC